MEQSCGRTCCSGQMSPKFNLTSTDWTKHFWARPYSGVVHLQVPSTWQYQRVPDFRVSWGFWHWFTIFFWTPVSITKLTDSAAHHKSSSLCVAKKTFLDLLEPGSLVRTDGDPPSAGQRITGTIRPSSTPCLEPSLLRIPQAHWTSCRRHYKQRWSDLWRLNGTLQ